MDELKGENKNSKLLKKGDSMWRDLDEWMAAKDKVVSSLEQKKSSSSSK